VIALGLVGAAIGVLLFTVIYRWTPHRTRALVELARFDAHYHNATSTATPPLSLRSGGRDVVAWLGGHVARLAARHGISTVKLRQDVALTGRPVDTIVGRKVLAAVAGFLAGLAVMVALQAYGAAVPIGTPLLAAGLCAVAGFVLADAGMRAEARCRRRDFRRALADYLDLVSLKMAGLAAAEQALVDAARLSDQWPMTLVLQTLDRARLAGPSANNWEALAALGQRIGVDELRELGGLVKLVADDGAQVRATLSARAASMRRHELADAEGADAEKEQSMRLAQMLIVAGFLVFIGYPALSNVLLS
jgi:tight adherence protein C